MYIFISLLLIVTVIYMFLHQPQFGKLPKGEILDNIRQLPNFKKGQFQNLHHTPMLKEGVGYARVFYEFFFQKSKDSTPSKPLPSIKTNLFTLAENVLVWFGHSSYLIKVGGKNILVDPVFSGYASPVKFTTKSFKGSDVYTADDMPYIDVLFITHVIGIILITKLSLP